MAHLHFVLVTAVVVAAIAAFAVFDRSDTFLQNLNNAADRVDTFAHILEQLNVSLHEILATFRDLAVLLQALQA